jgi:hypothetical protein
LASALMVEFPGQAEVAIERLAKAESRAICPHLDDVARATSSANTTRAVCRGKNEPAWQYGRGSLCDPAR